MAWGDISGPGASWGNVNNPNQSFGDVIPPTSIFEYIQVHKFLQLDNGDFLTLDDLFYLLELDEPWSNI